MSKNLSQNINTCISSQENHFDAKHSSDIKEEVISNLNEKIHCVEERLSKLEIFVSEISDKMNKSNIIEQKELNINMPTDHLTIKQINPCKSIKQMNSNFVKTNNPKLMPLNLTNILYNSSSQPNTSRKEQSKTYSINSKNKIDMDLLFSNKLKPKENFKKQLFFNTNININKKEGIKNKQCEINKDRINKGCQNKFQTLQTNINDKKDLIALQIRTKTILEKYREFSKALLDKIKTKNSSYHI